MTRFDRSFSEDAEILDVDYLDDPFFMGRQRYEQKRQFARALEVGRTHPLDQYIAGYRSGAEDEKRRRRAKSWQKLRLSVSVRAQPMMTFAPSAYAQWFWRRRRGFGAAIGLVFGTGVVLCAISAATFVAVNWQAIEEQVALVRQNVACAETIAIRDDEGELIHVTPRLPDSACPQPLDKDGDPYSRPVLTVPLRAGAALAHAEAFRTIEGALWVEETYWGHDLRGPVRKIRGVWREFLTGQQDRSGVTGPIATVFEYLSHADDLSFFDKARSAIATSVYAHRYLTTNEDRIAFIGLAPSVANTVPLRAGELASLALFGTKEPVGLSEQCRFARAAGLPIPMVGARGVTDHMAGRWAVHVGPGTRLCISSLTSSTSEEQIALSELRSLCGDGDFCLSGRPHTHHLDGLDRDAVEAAWRSERLAIAENANIPKFLPLPQGFSGAIQAFRDSVALGGTVDGRTALEASAQARVVHAVDEAYASWDAQGMPGIEAAVAVFDVTDVNVRPISIYGERSGAIFPPTRLDQAGKTVEGLSPWHGASLNKIAIMMVAVREGITEVCIPDGTCLPLTDAFAQSKNDHFFVLAQLLDDELQAFRQAVGYSSVAPSDPDLRARDAVLGFDTRLSPLGFAVLLGALFEGSSQRVHLVDEATFGRPLVLEQLGFSAEIQSEILRVLATPIRPSGTLFSMIQGIEFPPHCAAVGGKSGTHSTGDVNLQLASILLVRCGDRHLVSFALASHQEVLLLKHEDLGPLHVAAIAAASE